MALTRNKIDQTDQTNATDQIDGVDQIEAIGFLFIWLSSKDYPTKKEIVKSKCLLCYNFSCMKSENIFVEEQADEITLKLKACFQEDPNVLFAFIFGSYVRGRQKRGSDLDVAIFFKNLPEGLDLLHYTNRLSDISGKEVHLVVLNNAPPLLRHQVVKYGIRLIKKDEVLYTRFREKTMTDYEEYKNVSGMNIYD